MGSRLEVTTVEAPVTLHDQLVNIGGVERVNRPAGEIVQDQKVRPDELSDLTSWLLSRREARRRFQQYVGPAEHHAVTPADRSEAEGVGHERLADTDRAEHQGVVAGIDGAQRAKLVPDLVVGVDLGGGVPVLQAHVRVESGGPGPERAEVVLRLATSSDSTSSKNSA